jgi:hypothetical protein
MVHKEKPIDGYLFILLPHRESLRNAATTQAIEEGAEADPLLCGVSLLKLCRPSWMAQTWVDAKLKSAIEEAGQLSRALCSDQPLFNCLGGVEAA